MHATCCLDPRPAAPALIRWSLGLLMLTSGVSKLMNLGGFVNGYLQPAFEQTFLPGWLTAGYGYALPPIEAALGLLLLGAGAGAEMRRSLGTAVFSGMLGVTFFGVILTPVFFFVVMWFSERKRRPGQDPA